MARNDIDILIGGGGFAGLALAIALRQSLGPSFAVVVADPALGASHADDDRALGHRGGRAAIVRGDRRVGAHGGRGAADPRHGGDRQPARRRGAAGIPQFRRRHRARRAVRPHDREPASGRCARREGEGHRRRIPARRSRGISRTKARGSTCGLPMARRYRQDCSSPRMARARPFANAPASPRMAGAIRSPPS